MLQRTIRPALSLATAAALTVGAVQALTGPTTARAAEPSAAAAPGEPGHRRPAPRAFTARRSGYCPARAISQ